MQETSVGWTDSTPGHAEDCEATHEGHGLWLLQLGGGGRPGVPQPECDDEQRVVSEAAG